MAEHNHVIGGFTCPTSCPAHVPSIAEVDGPEPVEYAANMTLRDHFAGLAMAAYLSVPSSGEQRNDGNDARGNVLVCATWAYENADAMLRAREAK